MRLLEKFEGQQEFTQKDLARLYVDVICLIQYVAREPYNPDKLVFPCPSPSELESSWPVDGKAESCRLKTHCNPRPPPTSQTLKTAGDDFSSGLDSDHGVQKDHEVHRETAGVTEKTHTTVASVTEKPTGAACSAAAATDSRNDMNDCCGGCGGVCGPVQRFKTLRSKSFSEAPEELLGTSRTILEE